MSLGLVQEVVTEENLLVQARKIASDLSSKYASAFASIKSLLRKPIAEDMMQRERASIQEFVEIWYSAPTWANLKDIRIY